MTEMDNVSIKVIEDARSIRSRNIKEAEDKAAGIIAEAAGKIKERRAAARAGAEAHYKRTFDMEVFRARSALDQKVLLRLDVPLHHVSGSVDVGGDHQVGIEDQGNGRHREEEHHDRHALPHPLQLRVFFFGLKKFHCFWPGPVSFPEAIAWAAASWAS